MTGHTLDFRCRQCGGRYSCPIDDGPTTLRLMMTHDADRPLPPVTAIHECTPRLTGVADLIGCTMPGPSE